MPRTDHPTEPSSGTYKAGLVAIEQGLQISVLFLSRRQTGPLIIQRQVGNWTAVTKPL